MISEAAQRIENDLARVLGVDVSDVRQYVTEVMEERLWRGTEKRERRTGFRFVRGSHSGVFVRDPEGTDVLPHGTEPPPERIVAHRG